MEKSKGVPIFRVNMIIFEFMETVMACIHLCSYRV